MSKDTKYKQAQLKKQVQNEAHDIQNDEDDLDHTVMTLIV